MNQLYLGNDVDIEDPEYRPLSVPHPRPQPKLQAPVRHITMSLFRRLRSCGLLSTTSFQRQRPTAGTYLGKRIYPYYISSNWQWNICNSRLNRESVGSVGLALLLWIVGAAISACSLAVSLEYGCMLPARVERKFTIEFTYRHPRYLASTLIAVSSCDARFTASNCIIFGEYVLFAFNAEPTEFAQKSFSSGPSHLYHNRTRMLP